MEHPRLARLLRVLLQVVATLLIAATVLLGVLAYPEPFYAFRVEQGRLKLYSDQPFDPAPGRAVLEDVERRLARTPDGLRDPDSVYRIFVTNAAWLRRLVFLWDYGAGGVNHYPIAGSVFIRQAAINSDRVLRSDGQPVAPPRTLAYFAAHEIGHSLIGRHIGAIANWRLDPWIKEGIADYIGLGGDVDIAALTRALRAGDPDLDPKRSGYYARYRLLVAYFLVRERWSVDRLLSSPMKSVEAAERLPSVTQP